MGLDISQINWNMVLITLFVLVWSIAIHEFGHAIVADRLGDDMPRRQGRITILPTEHFEPFGFMMMVWTSIFGFGLGWGKPVSVNPRAFSNPRRDMILVSAAGPFANLLLAIVAGLTLRFAGDALGSGLTHEFVNQFLYINLFLMFFNLIPVAPLDGSKILSGLLPHEQSLRYDRFMAQYGVMILLALVFLGQGLLGRVLLPPVTRVAGLLVGT